VCEGVCVCVHKITMIDVGGWVDLCHVFLTTMLAGLCQVAMPRSHISVISKIVHLLCLQIVLNLLTNMLLMLLTL